MFDYEKTLQTVKDNLQQSILRVQKATGTGAMDNPNLIPYNLSQRVTNMIQFMNPINQLINAKPFKSEGLPGGLKYEYRQQTGLRSPGNFGGEKSNGIISNASYGPASIYIKAKKTRMKVWNLGKKATENYIDMVAAQMAGESIAFSLDFAMGILYDNKILKDPNAADFSMGAWEDSIDTRIQTGRIQAFTNGAPTLPSSTKIFQQAYVRSLRNGGEQHQKVWLMSPEMAAMVTDFPADKVRLVQSIDQAPAGSKPFEVHVGLWAKSLFNIPIIVTTMLGGGVGDTTVDTMGSITLGQAASGGSLSNGTIYVKVTKVIRKLDVTGSYVGETMASAAASLAVNGGGSAQLLTVAWSADPNAIWYKVYACTTGAAADYRLVGVYAAKTLGADGDISGNVTTVNVLTITPDATLGIPTQGVYGKMQNDLPPVPSGGINSENVILWDLDETQGFGDFMYLDESANEQYGFATIKQIAEQGDYLEWLLYSYGTPVCRMEKTTQFIRGLRSA